MICTTWSSHEAPHDPSIEIQLCLTGSSSYLSDRQIFDLVMQKHQLIIVKNFELIL